MAAAPSMGVLAQLGMSTTLPITEPYEFLSESLAMEQALVVADGIRGTRSRHIERLVQGTRSIGGQIVLEPTPAEMVNIMPRIVGGTGSVSGGVTTFALAETLPAFYVSVDRVAKVYVYNNCFVDTATFSSGPNQLLKLALGIEAETETVNAGGSFPGLTIDTTSPFIFHESTLTLGGSTIQIMDVELTINNFLKKDRFVNSQTRTDIPPMDRSVTLKCTVPYTADTVSLYNTGAAGVTALLVFNYGGAGRGSTGKSIAFILQNIVFPARKSPTVQSKDEITLLLEGDSRNTGGTAELSVEIDTTA